MVSLNHKEDMRNNHQATSASKAFFLKYKYHSIDVPLQVHKRKFLQLTLLLSRLN